MDIGATVQLYFAARHYRAQPFVTLESNAAGELVPSLENCALVRELLVLHRQGHSAAAGGGGAAGARRRHNASAFGIAATSTKGLPLPLQLNEYGFSFASKTPLLRVELDDGRLGVLLRYNKDYYTVPKYINSRSILTEYGPHSSQLLPQLLAYCDNPGDSYNYLFEEYIPLHPTELPRPRSFTGCVQRLKQVVNIFRVLDEDLHLTFLDTKKGQWMARTVDQFVMPDADDMARSPTYERDPGAGLFSDQRRRAKGIVKAQLPGSPTARQVDSWWSNKMFPKGYTIRYTMLMLRVFLMEDLGMPWDAECEQAGDEGGGQPQPPSFIRCIDGIFNWTATPYDDWPAPKQVLKAIDECSVNGAFTRTQREPAEWRD